MFYKGCSSFTVTSVLRVLEMQLRLISLDYAYCKLKYTINPNRKTESSSLYHLK